WGPLCERRGEPLNPEVFRVMARALAEEYVRKRGLFLRIIPNAFAGSARAEVMQLAFSSFTRETLTSENIYRTFVLDLSPSLADLRRGLDVKWRNKLSGAEKNNLRVVGGRGREQYQAFCHLYYEMRKR